MQIIFSISFVSIITGLFGFVFYAFEGEKKYFKVATIATLLSFLSLTVFIFMHGIEFGFKPVDYLSQPSYIMAWLMMAAYFYAEYKYKIRILGSLFIPIVLIFMLIPVITGLNKSGNKGTFTSGFFENFHVILLLASFTLFFLAFAQAIIYIIKTRALKKHKSRALDGDLPSLGKLQKILLGTFNIGWICMTAGTLIAILNSLSKSSLDINKKITLGMGIWAIYTLLFLLYQFNKIGTRNLARAITFLFILFLGFFICYSSNFTDNSEDKPKQEARAGE